ncbi:PQQ-dependent sugar dehydrogenase [Hydrogenophaga sp. IBVHS2]|uniref:PQQ-dependent sugar dehydrogenase n=1 Tax=Hydrogenophaga sp. IBVHS2 TaxID=1985170 RepID=UPI001C4EEE6B|nr:PQQ-dependent sugar dehydrogenase [Hydrogenophaga sp. IBVHS2]
MAAATWLAPAGAAASSVRVEPVAQGLQNPWAMAAIGEGRWLVTERAGRMRVVEADGRLGEPLTGVPAVAAVGQGGLLDVIADRDFPRNRRVHFCYAEPGAGGNSTAMASAELAPDRRSLEDVRVVFRQTPKVDSRLHFGCRIVQAGDGSLFLTLGDRYHRMQDAQTLDNHHGKVVRVRPDGAAHVDNPFGRQPGVLPEIYSLGHRNPQGAALGPDGALWLVEHGPQGGDEVNRIVAGRNYGWPVITYGENYGGGPIGEGITARAGLEQPLKHWTPSIAPSGMAWLRSNRYGPGWQNSLFVGSLKFRYLSRLVFDNGRLVREERLLPEIGARVRDVREGPDGLLYLLTDDRNGRLLRVVPGG